MTEHMAIADSRHLWAEVDRLKAQVQELRTANRLAQEERARTTELLASYVTRAQLDAALSTKVSEAQMDAQMDALRAKINITLDQKADVDALVTLQNSKLDVSVFDSNVWDLQKLRNSMEQNLRDLFASFAGQLEQQVSSKLSIQDFIRVFNPDANGQKAELDTAALRMAKMTDQLESLNNYMNGDRQRQRQVAELNVNMLDLSRKQTAARNSIVQLQSSGENATAQFRALDEQTRQAVASMQELTNTMNKLQEQTQTDKQAQDERQTQLAQNVSHLEARDRHLTQAVNELQHFAHEALVASLDAKLKTNSDKLYSELSAINATYSQHTQQVTLRMKNTQEQLLQHKEHLEKLDACMRKVATLLRETQGELNNVKGPLATLATNLHEENIAILQEVERSQNSTRNIMLDYQDILEREANTQLFSTLPSRPSSSFSTISSGSPSTSRKHKQQMLLATRAANRPHTSSPRIRQSSTPNAARPEKSAGAVRSNASQSIPLRAQTAGSTPKVNLAPVLLPHDNVYGEFSFKGEQELRGAMPTAQLIGSRMRNESSLVHQQTADSGDEELFHFPQMDDSSQDRLDLSAVMS